MDVSQYLDIFIDETNGHIQDLNDSIMILERNRRTKMLSMRFSVRLTR